MYCLCYRGGTFLFSFNVSPIYPHEAPKVKCKTKVIKLVQFSKYVVPQYSIILCGICSKDVLTVHL